MAVERQRDVQITIAKTKSITRRSKKGQAGICSKTKFKKLEITTTQADAVIINQYLQCDKNRITSTEVCVHDSVSVAMKLRVLRWKVQHDRQ